MKRSRLILPALPVNPLGRNDMRRLADSILSQPGAWPGPAEARRCEQFLCGPIHPEEKRAVVRELLHRAGRRSEEG